MLPVKFQDIAAEQSKSISFFKGMTLFQDLPEDQIQVFIDAAQLKNYKKGHTLYLQGDHADFFYIICSGWLKLSRTTQDGEDVVLAVLTVDSIAGKNAIFEDDCFASNAQIVEDAQILSIPLALLKTQLRTNNQLAYNMLTSLMHYQRLHELQLEQHVFLNAPQRIGCFMLGLCPALEQIDGVKIKLPYDKTLIASALGMKGATFSRALNILREETGMHINGIHVTIDSIDRLLNFVNTSYSNSLKIT